MLAAAPVDVAPRLHDLHPRQVFFKNADRAVKPADEQAAEHIHRRPLPVDPGGSEPVFEFTDFEVLRLDHHRALRVDEAVIAVFPYLEQRFVHRWSLALCRCAGWQK